MALRRSYRMGGVLLGLAFVLSACGSATGGTSGGVAEQAPGREVSGPASTPDGHTAGGLTRSYTGIPQSKTPEGYFVLGKSDAAVLIQHFSDFL